MSALKYVSCLNVHFSGSIANQPIPPPHIIVIAGSATRKRRYENVQLSEILVDKDIRQYPICWASLTARWCLCLFATLGDYRFNSLTSKRLPKPNNQPEWCCETSIKTSKIARATMMATTTIQVMCANLIFMVNVYFVLCMCTSFTVQFRVENEVYEGFYVWIYQWWISKIMKSPRPTIFDLFIC